MIKVAIMGHGTVGSGVYEVFDMNADKIAKTVGEPVEVKYVLDLRDFSSLPYGNKFVTDFSVIENDPEVTVVAEVMGGVGAAYQSPTLPRGWQERMHLQQGAGCYQG